VRASGHAPGSSALAWSAEAMTETISRLNEARAGDRPAALSAISDAVWRVTIVDATFIRYRPEEYDRTLARCPSGQRRLIEDTLAGLRFVRNHLGNETGLAGLVGSAQADGSDRVTAWVWRSVRVAASAGCGSREWEHARHRAYEQQLAGSTVGEVFARVADFLQQAAGAVPADARDRSGR
jgi:hypothetical protein